MSTFNEITNVLANPAPLYDMCLNPVYQVDFSCMSAGKRISISKQRVRFRFGFSNAQAIVAGESGPNCRGEEHDVTLVWSLGTGKRLILADGEEVHYSMGSRAQSRFEKSWTMKGGHEIKLIAHAAPAIRSSSVKNGFRQYDLFLDGQSFFDMPKIFELGSSSSIESPTSMTATATTIMEKSDHFKWANTVQEHETRRKLDRSPSEMALGVEDLLDVIPCERSHSAPANLNLDSTTLLSTSSDDASSLAETVMFVQKQGNTAMKATSTPPISPNGNRHRSVRFALPPSENVKITTINSPERLSYGSLLLENQTSPVSVNAFSPAHSSQYTNSSLAPPPLFYETTTNNNKSSNMMDRAGFEFRAPQKYAVEIDNAETSMLC